MYYMRKVKLLETLRSFEKRSAFDVKLITPVRRQWKQDCFMLFHEEAWAMHSLVAMVLLGYFIWEELVETVHVIKLGYLN